MAISDDDLDECFSTDDFAVEAIFETSAGSVTVNGYFTKPTDAVNIGGTEIDAIAPTFQARTSETEDVRRNDSVTIPVDGTDTVFSVERYQHTGMGVTVFFLKS